MCGVVRKCFYGPNRKRYKKKRNSLVTHYLGDSTEIIHRATPEIRYTLKANGVAFMIRRERGGTVKHHYLHRDHLGSITAVTDEADGSIVERYSYDAWGKRRIATNWQASDITTTLNYRGYTGHEHLDDVGIIHMNGRLYSPKLGRMLSPDPVTQAPENGQNYNRYSYVFNNPLKFTDPSGYKATMDVDPPTICKSCDTTQGNAIPEMVRNPIEEVLVRVKRENELLNWLRRLRVENFWRGLGQQSQHLEQREPSDPGEERPQSAAGDDGKRNDVEPSEENPLGLSPEDARKTLEFFYPKSNDIPAAEDIGNDMIQFANKLIMEANKINSVSDIMQNFSPGSPVKPTAMQIFGRIVRYGLESPIQNFGGYLTFGEKLRMTAPAARNGTADIYKTEFELLLRGQ